MEAENTEGISLGTVSLLAGDIAYLLRGKGNHVSIPHVGILLLFNEHNAAMDEHLQQNVTGSLIYQLLNLYYRLQEANSWLGKVFYFN